MKLLEFHSHENPGYLFSLHTLRTDGSSHVPGNSCPFHFYENNFKFPIEFPDVHVWNVKFINKWQQDSIQYIHGILPMDMHQHCPKIWSWNWKKWLNPLKILQAQNQKYFVIFTDYFDATFTQKLKENWNRWSKIFQKEFLEESAAFPCFYLPGSLPCRGSWKIPLFHSPCGPCCPSTGWFQHSWSGERKEVKHSLKYPLHLPDLCRNLQFVNCIPFPNSHGICAEICNLWTDPIPKQSWNSLGWKWLQRPLTVPCPWENSGWLSQICWNLHYFPPCSSQKTTKHPLGRRSLRPGAAHLWFTPFISLDLSPGGSTQGRTRIIYGLMLLLQLRWTKPCPNLFWKAGKCPKKKCT